VKRLAGGLALFALLLAHAGAAFAQTSDFETIDSFKKQRQALLESVKTVRELAQCSLLDDEIVRLEGKYGLHRQLLDEGLYPESFATVFAELREQLKKSTERLTLAEENRKAQAKIEEETRRNEAAEKKIEVVTRQREEYRSSTEKLTVEVQDLSARVALLSSENAGLLGKIQALQLTGRKDRTTIATLQALTERLNANIRDRDELIVKLMDSLFDEYAKAGLTDVQKKTLLPVVQGNDYVSKIVATLDGNISYVGSALLTAQDVTQLTALQRNLAAKWGEIKPYVSKLYPDEQTRARDLTTVDGRLAELKRGLDEATWRSVHEAFAARAVAVEPFHDGSGMHAALLAYLDEQLKRPSREKFRAFKRVWDSPIKDQWLPVIPLQDLSPQQRGEIEARIALWDKKITTVFWLWVAAGAVVAVAAAAALFAIRRKNKLKLPA
jgi:hypothetical protein